MVIFNMDSVGLEISQCKDRLEEQLQKAKGSLNIVDTNLRKFATANSISRPGPRRVENFDQTADKWKIVKDNNFNTDLRNSLSRRRLVKNYIKADAENIPLKKNLRDTHPKVLQCSITGPPVVADYESDDEKTKKPVVSSYVIAKPVVIPSRKEAVSAKTSNETRARDKRIFGALLGTLKKFRQEESQLKEKVDKKAQIEKKLEDAAKQEKERVKEEKAKLIKAWKDREAYIKEVEAYITRLKSYEEWEKLQTPLFNYVKTKAEPHIYFAPKIHCKETDEKWSVSREELSVLIEKERLEIKKDVDQLLEKWNISNLESIPEVFLNQQQHDVNGSYSPVFENIHATVTVKPQKSPVSTDDEALDRPRIKIEKKDVSLRDSNTPVVIGSFKIKVEKSDNDDETIVRYPFEAINIKQEHETTSVKPDKEKNTSVVEQISKADSLFTRSKISLDQQDDVNDENVSNENEIYENNMSAETSKNMIDDASSGNTCIENNDDVDVLYKNNSDTDVPVDNVNSIIISTAYRSIKNEKKLSADNEGDCSNKDRSHSGKNSNRSNSLKEKDFNKKRKCFAGIGNEDETDDNSKKLRRNYNSSNRDSNDRHSSNGNTV